MARPKVVTALTEWMRDQWLTDAELAVKLNAHPKLQDKTITARQIARWRKGLALPRPYYVEALREMSDGKVTADSFYDNLKRE
jgi:hypothetical protein